MFRFFDRLENYLEMECYLQFVRFFVICVSLSTVQGRSLAAKRNPTTLVSVFNSFLLSSIYRIARKRAPALNCSPHLDAFTKDEICQKVILSDYFRSKNYEPVNMEKIYLELLDAQYENIHDDVFVKSSNSELISLFSTDNNYTYENPYYLVNGDIVVTREDGPLNFQVENEYMFTCLVRHSGTGELVTFYISREYDTADKNSSLNIRGRFIFQGDRKEKLRLVALAEEPAEVFYGGQEDQVALERTYIQMKKSLSTSEEKDKGALCGFVERTRLCSSLLAGMSSVTTKYRDHLSILEYYEPIECFEKEVSFWTDEVKNEIEEPEKYLEWMIYCEARDNREDYPNAMVRFFVSNAWNPNHVFIYFAVDEETPEGLSDGKAFLENLSANVSVNGVYE